MLIAYIDYENKYVELHRNSACQQIEQRHREGARLLEVTVDSFSEQVRNIIRDGIVFDNTPEYNDLWIDIEFGNGTFEIAVLEYLMVIFDRHNSKFPSFYMEQHC